MKIGIDLTWVKHKKNGGLESYIRNLLDGFFKYSNNEIEFILFLAENNYKFFDSYLKNSSFKRVIVNINSEKVISMILWQNLKFDNMINNENIDVMFVPIYNKPLRKSKKIPYIIVIHDLQAIHYPEYFSKLKCLWLKYAWKRCANTADRIVAISNFVKNDIVKNLKVSCDKVTVIYNPIITLEDIEHFSDLQKKYDIENKEYFYTVSSMLPHKNLKTIIQVMSLINKNNLNLPKKLVISGVGGKDEGNLRNMISEIKLEDKIIITGFVTNAERDCLYKNSSAFLFPSLFEGFGMPPIEALMKGTPVLTTKSSSIMEVTKERALYVDDPLSCEEWVNKMFDCVKLIQQPIFFKEYDLRYITSKYLEEFKNMI